jgi:hypothetical protein
MDRPLLARGAQREGRQLGRGSAARDRLHAHLAMLLVSTYADRCTPHQWSMRALCSLYPCI